jgi:FlaG/FlaF family flagellin (archaellin)
LGGQIEISFIVQPGSPVGLLRRTTMKVKTMVLLVAACLAGATVFAADPQIGTWKLNEAKSKLNPAASKDVSVIYEAVGDNVKVTVEGTTPDGKAYKSAWTGKYDGKDYPVTGDPLSDMRSYTKVDDRTLTFVGKKDGKVALTGRITVAADGKSRTVTSTSTDAKGQKANVTAVYDKQ